MEYYLNTLREFSCIGGNCRNNCCHRWKIIIDDESLRFYEEQNDEFGRKLQKYIATSPDGMAYFPCDIEDCHMLTEEGLCSIYKHYGEEHMCRTCQTFPRVHMTVRDTLSSLEFVTNECEEVLRLLMTLPEYAICVDTISTDEDAVDDVVGFGAWILESIQDESNPIGMTLSTILYILVKMSPSARLRDRKEMRRILDNWGSVVDGIGRFVDDFSDEELERAAWGLVTKIVIGFLDILYSSNFVKYEEILPDKRKYDKDSPDRGEMVKIEFQEFVKEIGMKDGFLRRYLANIIISYLFYMFREDGEDVLLYELAPKLLLSLIVPSLWDPECWKDEKDYLARLGMLQRIIKGNLMENHLSPAIREQMELDAMVYAVMYIGVLDRS